MNYDTAYKIVRENRDHSRFVCGLEKGFTNVEYGDFLLSGLNSLGTEPLGYVVQIRKEWGAFGSDMYLIREHDGKLNTHENQSFWKLSPSQSAMMKEFFKYGPEEEILENPELFYSIKGNQEESGFLVIKDNAPDRVDICSITMTITGESNERSEGHRDFKE